MTMSDDITDAGSDISAAADIVVMTTCGDDDMTDVGLGRIFVVVDDDDDDVIDDSIMNFFTEDKITTRFAGEKVVRNRVVNNIK